MMELDPIEGRRDHAAALSRVGKRLGYTAIVIACIGAAIAVITDFKYGSGLLMAAGLVLACLVLPIAIIVAFGVRAAEREDRELEYFRNHFEAKISSPLEVAPTEPSDQKVE